MRINSIYPSIQGEGSLLGVPMVIVRLQGCAVCCPWCDTKQTWNSDGGTEMSIPQVVERVVELTTGQRWVLVTGGEPLEQAGELAGLTARLHRAGYELALETNGAHAFERSQFDWVCISPKDGAPVPERNLRLADEIKFVVGSERDLPDPTSLPQGAKILLQPLSQSPRATRLCVETVERMGWRLGIQAHKYLGLP
jgi:7-carboxy-7-deazaguanine synthase